MKVFSSALSAFVATAGTLLGNSRFALAQWDWGPGQELFSLDNDYGFGWQVAISGDWALVGSYQSGQLDVSNNTQNSGMGFAHMFDLNDGSQAHLLVVDGGEGTPTDYYGYTVAIDGDTALIGAYRASDFIGRAFVFRYDPVLLVWNQEAMLELGLQEIYPTVALSGNLAVVGTGSANGGIGQALVYERSGTQWNLSETLTASDGVANDQFGRKAVAIHDQTILVSAHQEVGETANGKAYAFHLSNSQWVEEAIFRVEDDISLDLLTVPNYLQFGGSLAIDGDTALVSSSSVGFDVYIYRRDGPSMWSFLEKLQKPRDNTCFGCSLSIKGNNIVVGEPYLRSSFNMFLGKSVAMGDGKALVSADGGGNQVEGSVFVFEPPVVTSSSPTPASTTESPASYSPTPSSFGTSGSTTEFGEFWCMSGMFGDPHISTFDDLRFDCQAAGEFIMVKSADLSFQVQERFTAIDDTSTCTQSSVSTGIVVQDPGAPTVQISTPRSDQSLFSLNTVNGCPIDFYVNNIPMNLPLEGELLIIDELGNEYYEWTSGPGLVSVEYWGEWLYVYNTDNWFQFIVKVEQSDRFGCHFATQVNSPGSHFPDEELIGLLGTCNYDSSDDWRAANGDILTPPATPEQALFSTSYNYCVDNWCIQNAADSIFTYGTGESFTDIYKCDQPYINEIESQVASPPQELIDTCGASVACMIDGLCGDMSDAQRALEIETLIVNTEDTPPGDWEIIYNGMMADFSTSSIDEVAFNYDISVDREYETAIFKKGCIDPIDDIDVVLTSSTRSPKNNFHDSLVLTYDVDKNALAGSSLWNSATNQLELCQVVNLIIPESATSQKWVMQSDTRDMAIDFDLFANFEIDNTLGVEGVREGSGSTDLDGFLAACRCNGVGFICLDPADTLLANEELSVCIWSVSPEVAVDSLDTMVVSQDPSTSVDVIANNAIVNSQVTSREFVPEMWGVVVSTRLPANVFAFSAGQSITVTGAATLDLVVNVNGRKLQLFDSDPAPSRSFKEKKATYEVKVGLAPRSIAGDEVFIRNSASLANSMRMALFGMVFVFIYILW